LDMPAITLAAPILPNREEEWRRFVQEVVEERLHEYEEFRRRLGIRNESVWLARMTKSETAIMYLEAKDPERIVPALAASEEPFDLWFKEWLLECHGLDLLRAPGRAAAKLIFAYRDVSGEGSPAPREGGS
jgi:predicted secreted hydrolase